jgi:competence protein ComEC
LKTLKDYYKLSHITSYSGILLLAFLLIYLLAELIIMHHFGSYVIDSKTNSSPRYSKPITHNIKGRVISLPIYREQYNAWYFTVETIALLNNGREFALSDSFPKKIRLAWYKDRSKKEDFSPHQTVPKREVVPKLGEHWSLWVRFKPIHSHLNPGSFDYERWAFVRHIESRGYVRNSTKSKKYVNYRLEKDGSNWVEVWRTHLRNLIEKSGISLESQALVKALMIGDKSALSQKQWDAFRDAGISHLLAISGLHIGLVALFMGWLGSCLWRLSARACRIVPAPYIWFFSGLLSASVYAMVAGFEVPVQRALVMLFVAFFGLLYQRHLPNLFILLLAFIAVMLIDVRAFYATGFWLSFVSVAIILFLLRGQNQSKHYLSFAYLKKQSTWQERRGKLFAGIYQLFRLQFAITICLIPLLLFFFQTASVISPLANLSITPLVGIFVVPFIILAVFMSAIPMVFDFLMLWLGFVLEWLNVFLLLAVEWLDLRVQLPSPSVWGVIIATIVLVLAFIASNWKKRLIAVVIAVVLLFPFPRMIPEGVAEVNVLDVGQGLSIVVFTKNHSLIYDFGNRGLGRSVVYPFMNSNFRKADKMVISHHDIDHYGGSEYVIKKYPKAQIIDWNKCSGEWMWDKVKFQLLQYQAEFQGKKIRDNNVSCIVKITSANNQSMLLTADIEKEAERWLINNKAEILQSNVLLVPHQGSKTSSTREFLQAVNPQIAVVSAGYKNHFRHPHPKVVKRYQSLGVSLYDTICGGMITISLGEGLNENNISQYRKQNNYFWRRQCLGF